MWLEPLSHWFVTVAILSQAGATPPALPEPITTQQPMFAIPFRVDRGDDPARQPVEVQLLVSTDRGTHWQFYARAQPTEQRFMFRAGVDGEYWFAIRTVDRSGRTRPETIAGPGLRVLVDSKQKPANTAIGIKTPPATRPSDKLDKPAIDANPSPGKEPQGSVAIAINPAIGKDFGAKNERRATAETAPSLPPGERPRMVNSRLFELEYDVDSVGPSGIGRVELWGTRDRGKTWRRFTVANDNRSPLRVNVDEEGIYGFRVVVTNGAGLGGNPPKSGDLPDLWIGVDLTKPTARIVSAEQGVDAEAGRLIISWQADDKMLAARPVSLSFSQNRGGPWLPVASGLENTGRYAWPIDNRTPSQFYLRLEVRDEAGNIGAHQTPEPVTIDQSRPTIRVREVRPVEQTSARPVRRS
jgi:hypothetical protein